MKYDRCFPGLPSGRPGKFMSDKNGENIAEAAAAFLVPFW